MSYSSKIAIFFSLLLLYLLHPGQVISAQQAEGSAMVLVGSEFVVSKTADTNDGVCDSDCSLREAIIAANAASGADVVTLANGIYSLTVAGIDEDQAFTGDLDITDDVTINGIGASLTVIDGGGIDRVFHITATLNVTIAGVTIRNGKVDWAGGGIWVNSHSQAGVTHLNRVVITANSSSNGGGIALPDGGKLFINDSTIYQNFSSGVGGGIQNYNGVVSLVNTTLTRNTATGGGGGGGIYNFNGPEGGTINLNNSTVSFNSTSFGGAIVNFGGTINLKNTIFSNNIGQGCTGPLTSQGYNLISYLDCSLLGDLTGNIIGQSPNLGELQNNGGTTLTHVLQSDSPAVNAGNPAVPGSGGNSCVAVDQRGMTRPQNGRCDIGAYELTPGATIVGSVYNAITHANVFGVAVRLDYDHFGGSPSYYMNTDIFGNFQFMNIPPGKYSLVSFPPAGWIGSGKVITLTGNGTFLFPLALKIDIPLLAPANNSAIETTAVNLCWEDIPQAVSYVLQLNGPGGILLANPSVQSNCYRVSADFQDSMTYTWSLANAFNSLGESIGGSQTFLFTYHSAPITQAVVAVEATTISSWDQQAVVDFPPNSFSGDGAVTYQPAVSLPSTFPLAEVRAYELSATVSLNAAAPYQVSIAYLPADTRTIDPSTLGLYYWDPVLQQWIKEPTSQLDPVNHLVTASPTHFSTWALLGESNWVYLPIVRR